MGDEGEGGREKELESGMDAEFVQEGDSCLLWLPPRPSLLPIIDHPF